MFSNSLTIHFSQGIKYSFDVSNHGIIEAPIQEMNLISYSCLDLKIYTFSTFKTSLKSELKT